MEHRIWSDAKAFLDYHYAASGYTRLDNWMAENVWTPSLKYIPYEIHPNCLTLLGFASEAALMVFLLSRGDTGISRTTAAVALFVQWSYQYLDAMDGRQARRLKLSTPFGQLLDHGCDAFTSVWSSVLAAVVLGVGYDHLLFKLLTILLTAQVFMYAYLEVLFGKFRCATGPIGVTEGQFVLMSLCVYRIIHPSLGKPLGVDNNILEIAYITTAVVGSACLLLIDFKEILTKPPASIHSDHPTLPQSMRSLYANSWIYFLHLASMALCLFSGLLNVNRLVGFFNLSTGTALLLLITIYQKILKQPLNLAIYPQVLTAIGTMSLTSMALIYFKIIEPARMVYFMAYAHLGIYAVAFLLASTFLQFIINNFYEPAKQLGIPLLHVPIAVSNAAKKAAGCGTGVSQIPQTPLEIDKSRLNKIE